ncbi:hypothetical protein ATKI12_2870 [Kitasatospora sp. Ki12]
MLKFITRNYDIAKQAAELRKRGEAVNPIEATKRLLVPFRGGRAVGLSAAEHDALRLLARVYVATTTQLGRYLFPDSSPATRERKARLYAERLARYRLIARHNRPGVQGQALMLTENLSWLSGVEKDQPVALPPIGIPYGVALQHRLKVTELYVRLVEHYRDGGSRPHRFRAFPDGWRSFIGLIDKDDERDDKYVIRPDAAFRLLTPDSVESWLVTFYDGSETDARITTACNEYFNFARFQVEREETIPSRVLLVAETYDHADHIQRVVDRQPERVRKLFTVCTMDDAVSVLDSSV